MAAQKKKRMALADQLTEWTQSSYSTRVQVIGDEIWFGGVHVANIVPDAQPTMLGQFIAKINSITIPVMRQN